MKVHDIEQRTKKWRQVRQGVITASNFHKLAGARGIGKMGESYVYELAAGMKEVEIPDVFAKAMEWGTDLEPDAFEYYKLILKEQAPDMKAEKIGFCSHDKLPAGCSPDGIVYESHGVEIKCPYNPGNHIKHMMITDAASLLDMESKYYWQVMFSMWVTGMKLWHFVSYDPRFTGRDRMHIASIHLPDDIGEFIEERVTDAQKLLNTIMERIG